MQISVVVQKMLFNSRDERRFANRLIAKTSDDEKSGVLSQCFKDTINIAVDPVDSLLFCKTVQVELIAIK